VDIYEIAVLRILVKKHNPMKVSNLVNGFPDNSEDNVLQAVSNLHFLGYVSVYDSFPQHISLTKDMKKEVLKIVNPIANTDRQTKQYFSKGVKKVDEIKNNMTINSRPVVVTRTTALAVVLIGSVIAGGASLLGYVPMANNQEPSSPLIYHLSAFSPSISKFQSLNTSTASETGLNSFAVAATIDPGGGSFIDNVFVVEYTNDTNRIIVDAGTDNASGASMTIYLKNAFVLLNI
jgi:hypothetical protein